MPHPYFVPLRSRTSRRTQSSGMSAGTSTVVDFPLTLNVNVMGDWGRGLLLHVFLQRTRAHFRSVDVAGTVRRDALSGARARWILGRVGNERDHFPILRAANADTSLPVRARLLHGAGLRIGDVNAVLLVDVDAARPAELIPRVEQLAVLIENFDSVVASIADEQPTLRVHRQRVRLV